MEIQLHNIGTGKAFVRINMDKAFVRGLKSYLHLGEDEPLMFNDGSIKALASGSGWYTLNPFNATSKGKDLEAAVQQIKAYQRYADEKTYQEFTNMHRYNPGQFRQLSGEDKKRFQLVLTNRLEAKKKEPRKVSDQRLQQLVITVRARHGKGNQTVDGLYLKQLQEAYT